MKHPLGSVKLLVGALFCATSLSGCGGVGRSAQDRINAALPPGAAITAAKSEFDALAKSQAADPKAIGEDYAERLKTRALECAHGYQPSAFAGEATIRDALTDKDCFAKADARLLEWLGLRRIGLLLQAPPLRPLPASVPGAIVAGDRIAQADFAGRAGVVLARETLQYQVLDVGSGESLAHGNANYDSLGTLSPNGRLFVAGKDDRTEIHETETGELLASFAQVQADQFHWIGDVGAIYESPWTLSGKGGRAAGPVFLDFASGQESAIGLAVGSIGRVDAMPGTEDRFLVVGTERMAVIALATVKHRWKATLVSGYMPPQALSWSSPNAGATADGKVLFNTGKSLQLVPLPSLQGRTVTFDPLILQSVIATPDPDKLLVGGIFENAFGAGTEYSLYSLSQRTLAKVDPKQFQARRPIYVASLHANALVEDYRIVMLPSITAAAPIGINEYLEQRAQVAQLASDALHPQEAQPSGPGAAPAMATPAMASDAKAGGPPAGGLPIAGQAAPVVNPGPLAQLGRNADIAAVGVFQAAAGTGTTGAPARVGTVQVTVSASSRPLILSLSAHDPVHWVVSLQPGARLAAVLTSGSGVQDVSGAGSAGIYSIGGTFAYKQGTPAYGLLDVAVVQWTGQHIGSFQGTYTGTAFSVGK